MRMYELNYFNNIRKDLNLWATVNAKICIICYLKIQEKENREQTVKKTKTNPPTGINNSF